MFWFYKMAEMAFNPPLTAEIEPVWYYLGFRRLCGKLFNEKIPKKNPFSANKNILNLPERLGELCCITDRLHQLKIHLIRLKIRFLYEFSAD